MITTTKHGKEKLLDDLMGVITEFGQCYEPSAKCAFVRMRQLGLEVVSKPSPDTIGEWALGMTLDNPETPCGCTVEPDGKCAHGVPSWCRIVGII